MHIGDELKIFYSAPFVDYRIIDLDQPIRVRSFYNTKNMSDDFTDVFLRGSQSLKEEVYVGFAHTHSLFEKSESKNFHKNRTIVRFFSGASLLYNKGHWF